MADSQLASKIFTITVSNNSNSQVKLAVPVVLKIGMSSALITKRKTSRCLTQRAVEANANCLIFFAEKSKMKQQQKYTANI